MGATGEYVRAATDARARDCGPRGADLCTPWCIRVAATLRVADHIAAGITDIEQLAPPRPAVMPVPCTRRSGILWGGVFEETAPGRFALNDAAHGLLGPPPHLDLEGVGGRFARAWSTPATRAPRAS
jgi:2,7-dihydroxy-5-methyl-1-naphthoate 7-O-methyltransferase